MLSDPADFSIRHALIWFQGPPPLLALRARCWPPARASHSRKLWHQLRPSMLTKWAAAAAHHSLGGPPTSRGEADREAACKSMNHAQKYLAQANRHIAELTVQIAHQRAIVKDALYTGQRSEMAESLLDALEGSLRVFEKHRIFLLGLQRQPSDVKSIPRISD